MVLIRCTFHDKHLAMTDWPLFYLKPSELFTHGEGRVWTVSGVVMGGEVWTFSSVMSPPWDCHNDIHTRISNYC